MRAKLRSATDDPSCKKSTTDSEAPSRDVPMTDKAEPMRANCRKEIDDPTPITPSTDTDEPKREKDLSDKDDPI